MTFQPYGTRFTTGNTVSFRLNLNESVSVTSKVAPGVFEAFVDGRSQGLISISGLAEEIKASSGTAAQINLYVVAFALFIFSLFMWDIQVPCHGFFLPGAASAFCERPNLLQLPAGTI
jgi:hypothetical protein